MSIVVNGKNLNIECLVDIARNNAKIQLFEVFLYEKFKGHEYLNYFFEKGNSMHGNDIRIVEERYNNYLADLNYKGTSKKMGDDYESYNNWVAKMRMGDDFESFNYWISKHEFHHELLKSFIQGHKYAEFKNTDDKPFKFSNDYFPEFFKELEHDKVKHFAFLNIKSYLFKPGKKLDEKKVTFFRPHVIRKCYYMSKQYVLRHQISKQHLLNRILNFEKKKFHKK